jgi:hypothetical protein
MEANKMDTKVASHGKYHFDRFPNLGKIFRKQINLPMV